MDNFDTEKFIIEIENRPAIWNSACSEYSICDVKRKCWEELTDIFSNEDNTVQEKKEIGELKKIIVIVIKINNNKSKYVSIVGLARIIYTCNTNYYYYSNYIIFYYLIF